LLPTSPIDRQALYAQAIQDWHDALNHFDNALTDEEVTWACYELNQIGARMAIILADAKTGGKGGPLESILRSKSKAAALLSDTFRPFRDKE
jgi:hypothetical protein